MQLFGYFFFHSISLSFLPSPSIRHSPIHLYPLAPHSTRYLHSLPCSSHLRRAAFLFYRPYLYIYFAVALHLAPGIRVHWLSFSVESDHRPSLHSLSLFSPRKHSWAPTVATRGACIFTGRQCLYRGGGRRSSLSGLSFSPPETVSARTIYVSFGARERIDPFLLRSAAISCGCFTVCARACILLRARRETHASSRAKTYVHLDHRRESPSSSSSSASFRCSSCPFSSLIGAIGLSVFFRLLSRAESEKSRAVEVLSWQEPKIFYFCNTFSEKYKFRHIYSCKFYWHESFYTHYSILILLYLS